MSTVKEKISYVIPIAFTEDKRGMPVLVYEVGESDTTVHISFGVYFIGMKAGKNYIVAIRLSIEDDAIIPIDSEDYANKKSFRVGESPEGEKVVSASLKVNFENVKIEKTGIYRVDAVLIDQETRETLDVKHAYFDIKAMGVVRDEFR